MSQCLISNCNNDATHNVGIRLRRPNTSAIWAPNTVAFFCDVHADQGYTVDITFTLVENRSITTNVSAGGHVETRTTPIANHP